MAGVALALATPLLSFDAISTRDQVARLEAGTVSPDRFDWAALSYNFGKPGRAAVKRLSTSRNAAIAAQAKDFLTPIGNVYRRQSDVIDRQAMDLGARLRVLPTAVPVPIKLRRELNSWETCGDSTKPCTLLYSQGAVEATVLGQSCAASIGRAVPPNQPTYLQLISDCPVTHFYRRGGNWVADERNGQEPGAARRAAVKAGLDSGDVEVRIVPRRQVFIGGVPVGEPFE